MVGVLRNTENSGISKGMISVMALFPIAYTITDMDDEVDFILSGEAGSDDSRIGIPSSK